MSGQCLQLGAITIGTNEAPLVIPEMGINHEGSLAVAKEMVLSAHRAVARLIKHQTHICSDEMSGAARSVIPGNSDVSIYDVFLKNVLIFFHKDYLFTVRFSYLLFFYVLIIIFFIFLCFY